MLTIQIDCACGHLAKISDPAATERWKRAERPRFRCSRCGQADQWDARLAWDAVVNQLEESRSYDG